MILSANNILLNEKLDTKDEAIRLVGKILVENGYVEPAYVDAIFEREAMTTTYMGNFVAIPHGTDEAKKQVKETGIVIIQVPDGVDFGDGNIVKLIFGLAGKGDDHLKILSNIAIVVSDEENVDKIVKTSTKEGILSFFEEVN